MNPNHSSLGRYATSGDGHNNANGFDEQTMQPLMHSSLQQSTSKRSTSQPQHVEIYEKSRVNSLPKQSLRHLDNSGEPPRTSQKHTHSGNDTLSRHHSSFYRHKSESFDDIDETGRNSQLNKYKQRGNITNDDNGKRSMDPTGMFRNRGRHIVGTNNTISSTFRSRNTLIDLSLSNKSSVLTHNSTRISPETDAVAPRNIARSVVESSSTVKNNNLSEKFSRTLQEDDVNSLFSEKESNTQNSAKGNDWQSIKRQHLNMMSNNFQLQILDGPHTQTNFHNRRLREGHDEQTGYNTKGIHTQPETNFSTDTTRSKMIDQEPTQLDISSKTVLNLNESLIDGESSESDDDIDSFDNEDSYLCDNSASGSTEAGSNDGCTQKVERYGLIPQPTNVTNISEGITSVHDQTSKYDVISNNKSHCRNSSNENDPQSPVESNVSVLGSDATDGDYSSTYDKNISIEVQKRMMQDVMTDDEDTGDNDGNKAVSSNCGEDGIFQERSELISQMAKKPDGKFHRVLLINEMFLEKDEMRNNENQISISLDGQISDTSFLDKIHAKRPGIILCEKNQKQQSSSGVAVADFTTLNNACKDMPDFKQEPPFRSSSEKKKQNPKTVITAIPTSMKRSTSQEFQSPCNGHRLCITPSRVQDGKRINVLSVGNSHNNTNEFDNPTTTRSLLPLPFQLARKCFSFEDTTTDDNYFLAPPDQFTGKDAEKSAQYKSYGLSEVASFPSDFENSQSPDANDTGGIFDADKWSPLQPRWHPPDRARLLQMKKSSLLKDIPRSQTWDNHIGSPTRPYKMGNHAYLDGIRQLESFDNHSPPPNTKRTRQDMIELGPKFMVSRLRKNAVKCSELTNNYRDFPSKQNEFETRLKVVERDRDYAVELLREILEQIPGCDDFCEHRESKSGAILECGAYCSSNSSSSIRDLLCESCQTRLGERGIFTCDKCSQKMLLVLTAFNEVNVAQDCNKGGNESSHNKKLILPGDFDVLFSSYEILGKIMNTRDWIGRAKNLLDALEKRSNNSNSLRSPSSNPHPSETNDLLIKGLAQGQNSAAVKIKKTKDIETGGISSSEVFTQNNSETIEGSPHQESEIIDPNKMSFRYSESIAETCLECRKQNLLLKAALNKANKTISDLQQRCDIFERKVPFESDIDPIPKNSCRQLSEDFFLKIASDLEDDSTDEVKLDDPALERELEEYKKALLMSLGVHTSAATKSSTSTLPNDTNGRSCQQQHTVNVKMVDSENFVTEWSDLVPPLPPPPDHGLRSPIVDTILDQWTNDRETKGTLISWIESIIEGANPESVPPLKVSGISHQIRDGFVMHVLPLLLHRKDLHVHVSSRAHRQTSYDIAVSISKTSTGLNCTSSTDLEHFRLNKRNLDKHHIMAYRASSSIQDHDGSGENAEPHDDGMLSSLPTHRPILPGSLRNGLNSKNSDHGSISTGITSPISNRTPTKKNSLFSRDKLNELSLNSSWLGNEFYYLHNHEWDLYPRIPTACASLGDDLSATSSASDCDDGDYDQNDNKTMWGAFGGLLWRRNVIHSTNQNQHFFGTRTSLIDPITTPSQEAIPPSFCSPSDPQSHHRVVSAPPGKIGLTFIEYRGHAMVSNVVEGSPLRGFVFQGDILLAIDETPVSGLRTKEIVKLLTKMKDRQRELRMISSRGMNGFVGPGSS